MTKYAQLFDALKRRESISSYVDLQERTGVARQTFASLANGDTTRPNKSTLRSLEMATGMPAGTLDAMQSGKITPQEAAARAGGGKDSEQVPEGLTFRVRNLESAVERIESDQREFRRHSSDVESLLSSHEAELVALLDVLDRLLEFLPPRLLEP